MQSTLHGHKTEINMTATQEGVTKHTLRRTWCDFLTEFKKKGYTEQFEFIKEVENMLDASYDQED